MQTSNTRVATILNPAPSAVIHVTLPNGSATLTALPDSGVDISAAGAEVLALLGKHELNLLPTQATPRAAKGTLMQPIGKIPVIFQLVPTTFKEDLHIY